MKISLLPVILFSLQTAAFAQNSKCSRWQSFEAREWLSKSPAPRLCLQDARRGRVGLSDRICRLTAALTEWWIGELEWMARPTESALRSPFRRTGPDNIYSKAAAVWTARRHNPRDGRAFPGRSRPLCPYPTRAQYTGSGNPEDAANFTCRPW